jgi:uncharacterized protein YhbP (UPF0306 family)
LWCANAFYIYDPQKVAFYLLSEDHTRHSQMTGLQANIAGTVNGQPKTVALIRGVQFTGRFGVLRRRKASARVRSTTDAFLLPAFYRRRCGKFASPS